MPANEAKAVRYVLEVYLPEGRHPEATWESPVPFAAIQVGNKVYYAPDDSIVVAVVEHRIWETETRLTMQTMVTG